MIDRTHVLDHALEAIARDDYQFSFAICGCGWEGPPCPDKVTAANFWGQHLIAVIPAFGVQR